MNAEVATRDIERLIRFDVFSLRRFLDPKQNFHSRSPSMQQTSVAPQLLESRCTNVRVTEGV